LYNDELFALRRAPNHEAAGGRLDMKCSYELLIDCHQVRIDISGIFLPAARLSIDGEYAAGCCTTTTGSITTVCADFSIRGLPHRIEIVFPFMPRTKKTVFVRVDGAVASGYTVYAWYTKLKKLVERVYGLSFKSGIIVVGTLRSLLITAFLVPWEFAFGKGGSAAYYGFYLLTCALLFSCVELLFERKKYGRSMKSESN